MVYRGRVHGGVVVLPEGVALREGTEVTVVPHTEEEAAQSPEQVRTVWDALSQLGRWAESQPTALPPDLAGNHDHYLHGLPKRE